MTEQKVVIIGGGAIGLSTAWYMINNTDDAKVNVTLIEKERIACHSSGKAVGLITSSYVPEDYAAIEARSWNLHAQLNDDLWEFGYPIAFEGVTIYDNVEWKGKGKNKHQKLKCFAKVIKNQVLQQKYNQARYVCLSIHLYNINRTYINCTYVNLGHCRKNV